MVGAKGFEAVSLSAMAKWGASAAKRGIRLSGKTAGTKISQRIGAEIKRRFNADYDGTLNSIKGLFVDPYTMPDAVKVGVALCRESGLTPLEIVNSLLPINEFIPDNPDNNNIQKIIYIGLLIREATSNLSLDEMGEAIRVATVNLSLHDKAIVINTVTVNLSLDDKAKVIGEATANLMPADKGEVIRGTTTLLLSPDEYLAMASAKEMGNEVYPPFDVNEMIAFIKAATVKLTPANKGIVVREATAYLSPFDKTKVIREIAAELPPAGKAKVIRESIAISPYSVSLAKAVALKDATAGLSPEERAAVIKIVTANFSEEEMETVSIAMSLKEARDAEDD